MISALLYLQFTSLRNRLGTRFKRLKRPKYLAGAVFGALYFIFYFSFLVRGPGISVTVNQSNLPTPMGTVGAENVGALLLFVVVLLGWILPNQRAALAFSEAEIAFLFPAPITRRGLIQFKLIRSQFAILFSILFLTLVWGRWRQGGHVWISLIGWWVILSMLNLHNLAGSFARTMLLDRGLTNRWRRLLIAGLVGLVIAVTIQGWPKLPELNNQGQDAYFLGLVNWLKTGLSTGLTPYLLYPFRLVVRPYFAPDAGAFFLALGPALAIMALHYYLVIRADVAFEEASIEYSRKLATRVETMRQRQAGGVVAPSKARKSPFKLKPIGPAPVAFLWKNLILSGSFFSFRTLWLLVWIIFAVVMFITSSGQHASGKILVAMLCAGLAVMSVFLGPQLLRADFRSDLPNAELLKQYPLPGWQMVVGQIMAPITILSVGQWLLITVAICLVTAVNGEPVGWLHKASLILAACIVAPAINLIRLLVPNAVALLLPSWVRFDKNAPRGFENFGQSIILGIGGLVVLLVTLLPAVLAFAAVMLLGTWLLGGITIALPMAALVGALVVVGEAAIAIYFLGEVFERFDVTAETTN